MTTTARLVPAAGAPRDAPPAAEVPSLSPSRANDFTACPLLYRFRVIDRLPDRPSAAAARGTLVHAVLERLFDLPPLARSPAAARALVGPQWQRLLEQEPGLAAMFAGDADGSALAAWLESAADLLDRYFALEDPTRLQPAQRELVVETVLGSGLRLRGVVDRLDVAPDGAMRIVDYKSGRAPGVGFEAAALFQLRFYALVLWRTTGRVPRRLQLLYLGGDAERVWYCPDEADLRATERKVQAIWDAVARATERAEWPATPGPVCGWCSYRALCPAYGGSPPPLPRPPSTGGDGLLPPA